SDRVVEPKELGTSGVHWAHGFWYRLESRWTGSAACVHVRVPTAHECTSRLPITVPGHADGHADRRDRFLGRLQCLVWLDHLAASVGQDSRGVPSAFCRSDSGLTGHWRPTRPAATRLSAGVSRTSVAIAFGEGR